MQMHQPHRHAFKYLLITAYTFFRLLIVYTRDTMPLLARTQYCTLI